MTLENIIGDEEIHKQAKYGDDDPANQEQIRAAHAVEDSLHRVIEVRGIQMQHICKVSTPIQQQGGNDIPYNFQGSPIVLVTAGLMAIAFFGFSGLL